VDDLGGIARQASRCVLLRCGPGSNDWILAGMAWQVRAEANLAGQEKVLMRTGIGKREMEARSFAVIATRWCQTVRTVRLFQETPTGRQSRKMPIP
jgi:hypothetical protein